MRWLFLVGFFFASVEVEPASEHFHAATPLHHCRTVHFSKGPYKSGVPNRSKYSALCCWFNSQQLKLESGSSTPLTQFPKLQVKFEWKALEGKFAQQNNPVTRHQTNPGMKTVFGERRHRFQRSLSLKYSWNTISFSLTPHLRRCAGSQ